MSRPESKFKMGYYPVEHRQWAAIISLFKFTAATRVLDPFAGMDDEDNGGHFLHSLVKANKLNGYVNELDTGRANTLIPLFGETHVVNGASEWLSTPNNAFPFIWANPPYDTDDVDSRRLELNLMSEVWDMATPGGYVVWCVYLHHLTDTAMTWFSSRVTSADVYALPGLHLDTYKQIIVVCQKTTRTRSITEKLAMIEALDAQRKNPKELTVQETPKYVVPTNPTLREFYFTKKGMDMEKILRVLNAGQSATKSASFQAKIAPKPVFKRQRAITPPRPGHTALLIGSGILNGVTLVTEEYGRVLLMADKKRVTTQVGTEYIEGRESDKQIITYRENTQITLRIMDTSGTVITFEGDEQILPFVAKYADQFAEEIHRAFDPIYDFDYGGYRAELNAVRLATKPDGTRYHLYHSQKHVAAAILKAFEVMSGVLFAGSMGTGKTSVSSTVLYLMTMQLAAANKSKGDITLVVCPPHLINKWPREISWQGDVMCIRVDDIEDLQNSIRRMDEAPRGTRKVLLIKRSVAALGQGFEPAVIWKKKLLSTRNDKGVHDSYMVAVCPGCGHQLRDKEGDPIAKIQFSNKKWECPRCFAPLWQEHRTPAAGEGKKPKKDGEDRKFTLLAQELKREGSVRTLPDLIPAASKQKYEATGQFRQRLDQLVQIKLKGRIGLLIWDEVHEAQTEDSGVGQAFNRIAGVAHKKLGLTGTPMNGKSTSVYNLEYAFNPETRKMFPRGGSKRLLKKMPRTERALIGEKIADGKLNDIRRAEYFQEVNEDFDCAADIGPQSMTRWITAMGVRQSKTTISMERHSVTGRLTGTTSSRRSSPEETSGITAELVAFMAPHTLTFSLADIGKWLPKFSEVTEAIELDVEVDEPYQDMMDVVKQYMGAKRFMPGGSAGVLSSYLQWAMAWPNNPRATRDVNDSIRNKKTMESEKILVAQAPALNIERTSKERRIIELVRADLAAKRKTIIFVAQTQKNDVQPHLALMLESEVEGAKPYILRSDSPTDKREAIIEQAVKDGYNVLICHPKLVETGLDLVQFQHIIVMEIIYEIRVLAQATKRCYRLSQEADECKVTYLYYRGTMEQAAMELMSRKSRAMKMLLGELGMTGFDALTAGDEAMNMEQMLVKALAGASSVISMEATIDHENSEDMRAVAESDARFWNRKEWLSLSDDGEEGGQDQIVAEVIEEAEKIVAHAQEEKPLANQVALEIVRRALAKMQKTDAPVIDIPKGRDWSKLVLAV